MSLDKLTVVQLYELAKEYNISGHSKMNKAALISALSGKVKHVSEKKITEKHISDKKSIKKQTKHISDKKSIQKQTKHISDKKSIPKQTKHISDKKSIPKQTKHISDKKDIQKQNKDEIDLRNIVRKHLEEKQKTKQSDQKVEQYINNNFIYTYWAKVHTKMDFGKRKFKTWNEQVMYEDKVGEEYSEVYDKFEDKTDYKQSIDNKELKSLVKSFRFLPMATSHPMIEIVTTRMLPINLLKQLHNSVVKAGINSFLPKIKAYLKENLKKYSIQVPNIDIFNVYISYKPANAKDSILFPIPDEWSMTYDPANNEIKGLD